MMSRVKQIAMAAGTFSVALGIGFVMQNGDALANRFGLEAPDGATAAGAAGITQVAAQGPQPADAHSGPALAASAPAVPELDAALSLPSTTRPPETATAPVNLAAVETDKVPRKPGAATNEAGPSGDTCGVKMSKVRPIRPRRSLCRSPHRAMRKPLLSCTIRAFRSAP